MPSVARSTTGSKPLLSTHPADSYDTVVIGAGLDGLTAAFESARHDLATLLFEQHNLPGEYATSFVRGRFEFETSLHEL
ncbi:MAG: hypothetical protein DRP57_07520, partial [Spirochaetes bacterium]